MYKLHFLFVGYSTATLWRGLDLLERPSIESSTLTELLNTHTFLSDSGREEKFNPLLYTAALRGPTYLTSF